MNIVSFLKSILPEFEEFLEPVNIPAKSVIEVGNVQIPVFGEILGIEKEILEKIQEFQNKIVQDLIIILDKIKQETKHGDLSIQEAVERLINAIKNKGNYILREPNLVTEFDSSLIAAYDQVMEMFDPSINYSQDLTYEVDGVLNIDLRTLANTYFTDWVNVGVQGETTLELVVSIYKKANFIVSGNDKIINIIDILIENVPNQVYQDLEIYEYGQSEYFLIELLAYTRSAVTHKFVKNSLISDLEEAKDIITNEFIVPDKKVKNKSNPKNDNPALGSDSGQTTEK